MAVVEKSPFADARTDSKPALPARFVAPSALIVFIVCLVLGLGAVLWRAARPSPRLALAQSEARALAAQIERQLAHVTTAAEVLGALARQAGGPVPNFQRVATDLLAAHPGLATLEWQPAGMVSEIVPRAGYESVIGRLNVFNDPAQRPGATAAYQRRGLTVAGPVPLYRGEAGVVARVPVFQRGRDGKETFGFLAVSMSLAKAFEAAGGPKLAEREFSYLFYAPARPGQPIARSGSVSISAAAKQPVRLQDVGLALAVQPRAGGLNLTRMGLECVGVLLISSLFALLVNLVENRQALEESLADATRRLNRESADRLQAQEECRGARDGALTLQSELQQARASLQQAQSKAAEVEARLAAAPGTPPLEATTRATLQQAETAAAELQARLNTTVRAAAEAARAGQAELDQMHAALDGAQKTIKNLESRLEAANRAEKAHAATAQSRQEKDAAAITELKSRLDAAIRAAEKGAEKAEATQSQLEKTNTELRSRLSEADQNAARVAELTALLERAQAELRRRQTPPPADVPPPASAKAEPMVPPPIAEPETTPSVSAETEAAETRAVNAPTQPIAKPTPQTPQTPQMAAGESEPIAPDHGQLKRKARGGDGLVPDSSQTADNGTGDEPSPPRHEPQPASTEQSISEPTEVLENRIEPIHPATEETGGPPAALRPAPPVKRRKTRRDDQMDLFGGPAPSDPTPSSPKPSAREPEDHAPVRRKTTDEDSEPVEEPDPAELRKAVNVILPLLTDQDPGAKDCLKDNRVLFRAALGQEGFSRFEAAIKTGDFANALEHLKKATRK